MDNIEKKCRKIAKRKEILIRKGAEYISLYYTVTIRKQKRNFHSWEDVFEFVNNY